MSKITFRIVPPVGNPSEPACVVGGHPTLGDWQQDRALPLVWRDPFSEADIEAETGTRLEYKIIRGSWEAEAVDAYGHVPQNSVHDVWLDATLHHTVADWKDRYQGRLTHDRVHSSGLAGWRDLLVWLPPEYGAEAERRFPVIYLHDGANVFDPTTSAISGVDLAADEWVSRLSSEGELPSSIVVGICHPEGFSEENHSLRDFDLSPELGGAAYAQFVATELVEHMDAHYRTLARTEARILGGAALGGLNTFFTALRHPGVFSKFICLSTSFEDVSLSLPSNSRQLLALADVPALPAAIRMFFGFGGQGLDECYEPYHAELGSLLRQKGWRDGEEFSISQRSDGTHEELSWRKQLGDALLFVSRPS